MDLTHTHHRLNCIAVFCASLFGVVLPSAHAQVAKYCDGNLVVNSIYSNVDSNGSRSSVSYFVQVQNLSAQATRFSVRFAAPNVVAAQNGSAVATIASYQQLTVTLGKLQFNNPAGSGAPRPHELLKYVQVTCPR